MEQYSRINVIVTDNPPWIIVDNTERPIVIIDIDKDMGILLNYWRCT
ncbi:MAG: hypothetical protein ACXADA_01445 [Candidatus Hodarchaeales archaeon]|jgi:hypothetical protein